MIFNNSAPTNISRSLKGQIGFIHIKQGPLLLTIFVCHIRDLTNNIIQLIFELDVAIPSSLEG